jgi:steroid 5-alpha reductase family enzyme
MNKNMISFTGICGAIVVATCVSIAGSISGIQYAGFPLFMVFGFFAFLVQWIAFVPAFLFQTEKYFDLAGSLTYIMLAVAALCLSAFEPGTVAMALMVTIWAVRLGGFLFLRVQKVGHDSRFRTIKPDFLQFLMTWTLQGLWVFLTFAAGLAAMTSGRDHPVDGFLILGCIVWVLGFAIEVVADKQKSDFRAETKNANRFIQRGLWAWSRHPNYFGEILLWIGIAIAAFPLLEGWQLITLISPLFVFLMLTQVSGVRMLENSAKKRWGNDPYYLDYQRRTPMLALNPWARRVKP